MSFEPRNYLRHILVEADMTPERDKVWVAGTA
jgi:hypothetical protein